MNKKLSQLTEKVTSLSADDLLYVSVNGESKSIRASVVEAPLKAYADQKKSELITEIEAVDDKLDTEIANRASGDTSTLNSAKAYTDNREEFIVSVIDSNQGFVSTELSNLTASIQNAVNDFSVEIQDAKDYADTAIEGALFGVSQTYAETAYLEIIKNALELADSANLDTAKSYTDSAISTEQSARSAADATTLQSAKDYTDTAIAGVSSGGSSPAGVILMFAGTVAPTGYLLCDGSAVSRSTYSVLFAVIGTSFGSGNGTTTFNLPNPDGNANLRYIIKI